MNTELLYTMGTGNIRSHVSVHLMQTILYLISIDMSKPVRGILIALFLSTIVSVIDMGLIHYYNSEDATVGGGTRYIRNLDDKLRIFRRIMFVSYGGSLALLTLLFFAGVGVAEYFMFTGPGSLLVLIAVMAVHDYSVNMRYAQLKKANWVFDYNRAPTVRTVSTGMNVGIGMFNDQNQFIINETAQPMEIDEVFDNLPPGTKMTGHRVKKPDFREIQFNSEFKYTSMNAFKSIYVKKENNNDMKIFNHFMKELSKYSRLYLIEDGFVKCLKTTIALNKEKVDKYIEENDYIKRFVPSKEAEVAYISMMLKPEYAKQSLKKFMARHTTIIPHYELRQTSLGLYLTEQGETESLEEDISYLQQYMSFNLDEYKCAPKPAGTNTEGYSSFEDKLQAVPHGKSKEVKKVVKTLHRLDIGGEKVYVFIEDLKTLGELDEIVFSKFINKDLKAVVEKHGIDG